MLFLKEGKKDVRREEVKKKKTKRQSRKTGDQNTLETEDRFQDI